MGTALRLLILEDSAFDAKLMITQLQAAGFELDWQRVVTAKDFQAALSPDLDMILADYSLPQWNALHALRTLQESKLDIPLIIVTGSVSEEVAVACMREGASDYLLKDRLQRLGTAVRQALDNQCLQMEKLKYEAALLQAAQEWRQTFDAMTDMITVHDTDFRVVRANRAAMDELGLSYPEILGQPCHEIFHHTSCHIENCPFMRTKTTGESEESIIWEPFMNKWLMVKSNPMLDENGELTGIVHVMRNITEIVRTEQALRESEERYRNLLDTSLVGIYITQEDTIKYGNQGLADIFGYETPDELRGMNVKELTHPDDYPLIVLKAQERTQNDQPSRQYRFRGKRADGSIVHIETLGRTIDYEGKPATQGFCIDVTAQVQAERDRESRTRQQAAIAQLGQVALAGISLLGLLNMAVKTVADTLEVEYSKVLHLLPDENEFLLVAGVGWQKLFVGKTTVSADPKFQAGYTLVHRGPIMVEDFATETRFQCPTILSQHQVTSGITVMIHGDERPYGILGAHSTVRRHFTEDDIHFLQAIANVLAEAIRQQQAKEALLRSEKALSFRNKVAHVLLTAPEDDVHTEVLTVIREATDSPYGFLGYIDEHGDLVLPTMTTDIWEQCQMPDKTYIFPPDSWSGLWGRALIERQGQIANEDLNPPPGHVPLHSALVAPILYQDKLVGAIAVANRSAPYTDEDLALLSSIANYIAPVLYAQLQRRIEEQERKRLEVQYEQVQRLDAIGQLTTGIAHDFNNMLTPIIGLAELIRMHTPKTDHNYELAQNIIAAGKRAAELVRQLLAFSRKQIVRPEVLDVADMLQESQAVLNRVISEEIHLRTSVPKGHSYLLIDPTQLQQVILNLAVNARDAMPDGGTLKISVDNIELDAEAATHLSEVQPGPFVRLTVSDTGLGMSAQVQAHIFEPFFTTKQRGQGTGLGLASVYGIVKQNKGDIVCESEEGCGTTFTIYLPRAQTPAQEASKDSKIELGWLRGSETILLVEDDPNVRLVTQATLQQLGYTVLEAEDGPEAMLLATSYDKPIELMLSDVIMPGIDGVVLAQEVKRYRPEIKVLFMSGYPKDVISQRGALLSDAIFIQKPFTPQTLAQHLRNSLDREG